MKPTRAAVLGIVRNYAIHDFPQHGGLHASTLAVAKRLRLPYRIADGCLRQLQREGHVIRLNDTEDMWRLV